MAMAFWLHNRNQGTALSVPNPETGGKVEVPAGGYVQVAWPYEEQLRQMFPADIVRCGRARDCPVCQVPYDDDDQAYRHFQSVHAIPVAVEAEAVDADAKLAEEVEPPAPKPRKAQRKR